MVRKTRIRFAVAGLLLVTFTLTDSSHTLAQTPTGAPTPGYQWSFPRDHANHSGYPVEWWYYTGHLLPEGEDASDHEAWTHLQLTFFRSTVPGPNSGELYFAHLAMSGGVAGEFAFTDRIARGTLGEAGSDEPVYHVWLDSWRASLIDDRHLLEAYDRDVGGIRLLAQPWSEPVLHGERGYSSKSPDGSEASNYYSLPSMEASGWLLPPTGEDGDRTNPVKVSGRLWMDHEFGNQRMGEGLVGWDWWGLTLPGGDVLMLYLIRRGEGEPIAQSGGTLVSAGGQQRHITLDEITVDVLDQWTSPHSDVTYPHGWRIQIPAVNVDITVTPVRDDQELRTNRSTRVTYYEGAVVVARAGYEKTSFGFVELVGYDGE
jgi:predicted secreted hydrolase